MVARRRAGDWGTWLVGVAALYAAAYVAWTIHPISLGGQVELVGELADYPVLIAATALALRAAGAVASPRARRGWRLLAAMCATWTVANAIYDYITLVRHDPAFPSIGDAFFVACLPMGLAGLLSFPAELGSRDERLTFALDAMTLMVGGGLVILHFVLLPVTGGHGVGQVALVSYYPLADMVLALSVVAVLFRHVPARTRRPLVMLVGAFAALFVADLVYAHDTLAGTYAGTRVTDSLWTVGYLVVALAAHQQHRAAAAGAAPDELTAPRSLSSWLPHAAVVGGLTVLGLEAWQLRPASLRVIVAGNALLVLLVVARQMVAARENARIHAASAARASEARFRALVQQSTDVIGIVDVDGRLRYLSPSGARQFGIAAATAAGLDLLERIHPDDRAAARGFLDRLVGEPLTTATATWRQRDADGAWRHVEVVGTNALAEPSVAGLVLNARDVSERVQLEREREQARVEREQYQHRLAHAQKMEAIGRLAGGVAHDMNNALSAIIATAELMADESADPLVRADADAILLGARRAAELTRNLLGFARQAPSRREVLRPESVVTSAVEILARSTPPSIRVETSFAAELAAIEGDPGQLHHALLNLGINAVDAMGERGTVTIGAHLCTLGADAAARRGLPPGDYVVLSVRDTGAGMDEATRLRVFEPFFSTKAPGKGTGLGLAMVYGTAQQHHGTVEVDSAPGEGATFRILIPASTRTAPVAEAVTRPEPVAAHGAGRVLIVDDEPLLRSMMQRVLEKHGYQVTVAAHGQEALALLGDHAPFDLVLLDMAMPVMAGPEVFRRARARHPALRVLLASGFASADDVQALIRDGACGLLVKPFSTRHLLQAVAAALRGQPIDAIAGLAS